MSVADQLHFATVNVLKNFALSSDRTVDSAYPLGNLQNQNRDKQTVFDMTGETTLTIQGTSAVEYTVNSLSAWNWNLLSGSTLQLLLYPDEDYAGTPVDTGHLDIRHVIPWGAFMAGDPYGGYFEDTDNLVHGFCHYFDEVSFKSWKMVITVTSTVNNEIAIGKIGLWQSYKFDYGQNWGSPAGIRDSSRHIQKPFGGVDTVDFFAGRYLNLRFIECQDTEALLLTHMLEKAKLGGDILVSLDPNNLRGRKYYRSGIFKRNNNDLEFTPVFFNRNSHSISLIEN